jgi:hypothetical protein
LSAIYCTPGPDNSRRIKTEKAVPTNPENNAKIKYNVPISFAFDDKNHLSFHIVILVRLLKKDESSFLISSLTVEYSLFCAQLVKLSAKVFPTKNTLEDKYCVK